MYGSMSAYKKRIGYSPTGWMFADNFDRGPVGEVNNDAGLAWGPNWSSLDWAYDAAVMADLPSLYLKLGEPSGVVLADSSGNALHGVTRNSPVMGAVGPGDARAITLNGTQWVEVPNNNGLLLNFPNSPDIFSLETWVRWVGGTDGSLFYKGTGGYGLYVRTATRFFGLSRPGVSNLSTSTVGVASAAWSHVVATKNGPTVRLYLDGVNVTGAVTNSTIVATLEPLILGREVLEYANASLSLTAMYPTALSAARVLAHYNARFNATPNTSWGFYSINASNQAVVRSDVWPGTWSITRFKNSAVFDRGYFVEFTFRAQSGGNGVVGFLLDAEGPASITENRGVFLQNTAGTYSVHSGAATWNARPLVNGEVVRARINPQGTTLTVSIDGVDIFSRAYVASLSNRFVGISQQGEAGQSYSVTFDNFRAGLL